MEKELPDEPKTNGGAAEQAPAVVLPSPNTLGVTGGLQGVASTIPAVSPQPFAAPLADAGDDALAARLESTLAQDGRFTAFAPGLTVYTADDGTVRVSGPVPSETQRQSLLTAIRSVHGVTHVDDALQVE